MGRRSCRLPLPLTTNVPLHQSISLSVNLTTSPARNPRRASSKSIALSRSPIESPVHDATTRSKSSGVRNRGIDALFQDAKAGMACASPARHRPVAVRNCRKVLTALRQLRGRHAMTPGALRTKRRTDQPCKLPDRHRRAPEIPRDFIVYAQSSIQLPRGAGASMTETPQVAARICKRRRSQRLRK